MLILKDISQAKAHIRHQINRLEKNNESILSPCHNSNNYCNNYNSIFVFS